MLGWSLPLFRIRGILLSLHASFPLLLAYFAWEGWQDGDSGWRGAAWNVGTLVAFFACVVLHELGHALTARRFGIATRRILLMPIGGMAEMDAIPRQPSQELLMTVAGPAVNFALAGLLWWTVRTLPDEVELYAVDGFWLRLFYANLGMGCFNLIPVFPMDGGRILRALLALRLPYLRATWWAASLGKLLAVVGAGAALWWLESDGILVAVLFAFIFVVGEMEYRAVCRRERDDEHWREVLARAHDASAPPPGPAARPG